MDATSVVPISLVIIGNQMPGAFVLPLRVPTFDPVDPSTGSNASAGYFSIDLSAMRGMPKTAQTYTIWAVAGEVIGGAVAVDFIPR